MASSESRVPSSVTEVYSSSAEDDDGEDDVLRSGSDTDVEDDCSLPSAHQQTEPCRYYNTGGCRTGSACHFLHLCKYAVKGTCRNGAHCPLAHPGTPRHPSGNHHGNRSAQGQRSQSGERKLTDERLYQWQLNDGSGWVDVAHDHILEAQYSLPNTSGICIFNTPYGRVNIDFERMRVRNKNIRVRRLDGRKTTWVWFYRTSQGWVSYDRKDSAGKPSPVKSSDIEQQFQKNPKGSIKFHITSDQYEIKFKERRQVGGKSRKVRRRPEYQQKQPEGSPLRVVASQHVGRAPAASQSPEWKFEGRSGKWHKFRKENGSSVSSADIEAQYQINSTGVMNFTANGNPFKLDFAAMKQINLTTMKKRAIRRS